MEHADQKLTLDAREAFDVMVLFLDRYTARATGYDLVDMLGHILPMSDGRPADPAAWEDWLQCVADVKTSS